MKDCYISEFSALGGHDPKPCGLFCIQYGLRSNLLFMCSTSKPLLGTPVHDWYRCALVHSSSGNCNGSWAEVSSA